MKAISKMTETANLYHFPQLVQEIISQVTIRPTTEMGSGIIKRS